MVRLPGAAARSPTRTGVEVREVTDAETLAVAERVLIEGYPMPGAAARQRARAPGCSTGPPGSGWGTSTGSPPRSPRAHQAAGATLVEYVAALPAARGRGAGAAVTWAATLADPDAPAVLVASDDGRPTYERMGYLAIERWTAWLRPT